MIKKTIRMSDCVGKYATLDHSIKNGAVYQKGVESENR